MQKVAKFLKVSEERFVADWCAGTSANATEAQRVYQNIKLPSRATKGAAGYDFFAPVSFHLVPNETIKIPTGIRVEIAEGWVLQIYPRSSLGFAFRLQMNNTIGLIDSDYSQADNEGHIFIKMTNATNEGKNVHIAMGEAFAQGVFVPFGITIDDAVAVTRTGGMGSTNAL